MQVHSTSLDKTCMHDNHNRPLKTSEKLSSFSSFKIHKSQKHRSILDPFQIFQVLKALLDYRALHLREVKSNNIHSLNEHNSQETSKQESGSIAKLYNWGLAKQNKNRDAAKLSKSSTWLSVLVTCFY